MKLYFTITCVSVCLSAAACPHYCRDPDVTWKSGRGCPPVVHYWADLESVHGLRCYGNIKRTRNVSEYMLVLALCLIHMVYGISVGLILSIDFHSKLYVEQPSKPGMHLSENIQHLRLSLMPGEVIRN